MKHIEKKILMLLSVVVLAAGCIKEDLDDCWNVSLYFQYLADGDKDVLSQYVDKVDLYVYNEQDELVESVSYHQDELINFQATPHFRLEPGRYRVVTVGNAHDQTVVVNEASGDYDNIYIQHPNWETGDVVTGHDHNYMGRTSWCATPLQWRVRTLMWWWKSKALPWAARRMSVIC